MNYAIVATKMDPQTKQEAQNFAKSIGVPLSVMFKAFIKQMLKTRTVTFSDRGDEYPNAYLKSVISQAKKDWNRGKAVEWSGNI